MSLRLLTNANVVTPDGLCEGAAIGIEGGTIAEIRPSGDEPAGDEVLDLKGSTLFPGFIDVHIHGAVGIDVNVADADGLLEIGKFLAKNGVTAWVPTLVPDSDENYRRTIEAIDEVMELQDDDTLKRELKPERTARVLGVHYEGVFANEKMCGALRPEFFRKYAASERTTPSAQSGGHPSFGRRGAKALLPRLKKGIHMTTLAPEIDGGIELIRDFVGHGWIVAIGHTKAEADVLDEAFAAGAKHLTHFYNAMTGLHHRDVGVVGWALSQPEVTFDIIADGMHVHPRMLEFACRSRSPEKVSLISDSVAPTGLGDGEFEIWGETVTVRGRTTRNERGSIAGSVITMLDAVKQMLSLGFTQEEVSRMASLNPAKLLGIEETCGSIEAGKHADLIALDDDGCVRLVMIGGEVVYNNLPQ